MIATVRYAEVSRRSGNEGPADRGDEAGMIIRAGDPRGEQRNMVGDEDPPTRVRGHGRVLVVDDNADAAELLAEALRLVGFDARVALDGPSALESARQFSPECAIVDIGLPVMDGYELGDRLRELLGPGLTLFAVTGYGRESDRERSRKRGFQGHFVKPVNLTEIIDNLTDWLERGQQEPHA